MQPFPHPNDGSVKILLQLAHWLQRYSSLKMSTDRHTDRRRLDWYIISSPLAFDSGELRIFLALNSYKVQNAVNL